MKERIKAAVKAAFDHYLPFLILAAPLVGTGSRVSHEGRPILGFVLAFTGWAIVQFGVTRYGKARWVAGRMEFAEELKDTIRVAMAKADAEGVKTVRVKATVIDGEIVKPSEPA